MVETTVKVKVGKAQPLKTTVVARSAKASAVKKKNVVVARPVKITGNKGTLSFKKVSGSSKLTVNAKTGKVTVKKGTKKGTYTVKIRISAAGKGRYISTAKTVTCKIKVK